MTGPTATAGIQLRMLRGPADNAAVRHRVLLLHGLGNSASVWRPTTRHWASDVEVWAAQLPWRGDGPADWSQGADVTHWVGAALDLVPGGVDLLVAHSFAANLTLELLSRELTAGLDIGRRYGLRGVALLSPFYRRRPEEFRWTAIADQLVLFQRTIDIGMQRHSSRPIAEELRADMVRHVCERIGPYGWTRFFDLYLRTPWLRTELFTLPCLVLAGHDDETAPPAEAVALAADLPYCSEHLLADCGHFPMIEQPERLVAILAAFLDTLPARDVRPGHQLIANDRLDSSGRLIPEGWYR